jgi:hypothetical protein
VGARRRTNRFSKDQDRLDSVLCAIVGYHWRTRPRDQSIIPIFPRKGSRRVYKEIFGPETSRSSLFLMVAQAKAQWANPKYGASFPPLHYAITTPHCWTQSRDSRSEGAYSFRHINFVMSCLRRQVRARVSA